MQLICEYSWHYVYVSEVILQMFHTEGFQLNQSQTAFFCAADFECGFSTNVVGF